MMNVHLPNIETSVNKKIQAKFFRGSEHGNKKGRRFKVLDMFPNHNFLAAACSGKLFTLLEIPKASPVLLLTSSSLFLNLIPQYNLSSRNHSEYSESEIH